MFFSGEASTRKRVDLGGRSLKERDRQKLLEQTKLERKRRLDFRLQNSAALKIQVRLTSNQIHLGNLQLHPRTHAPKKRVIEKYVFNYNSIVIENICVLPFLLARNSLRGGRPLKLLNLNSDSSSMTRMGTTVRELIGELFLPNKSFALSDRSLFFGIMYV